jgi:aspartyl-tRNA(Asn)/glutamyl-tRNA(Gln) amidotransferase subunit A
MPSDLDYTPAVKLAEDIKAKRLSPVELTDAVLNRIERYDPSINAFSYLAADEARAQARQAETALMSGGTLGPLHGVPVTVKDLAAVKDMPFESGSRIMEGNRATEDTVFVRRLREAGAIILGKTTTSEFGWKGVSQSPLTGITHNPWKHGYNAGASSAGAGAAAAAGFGPLHQGSDGAGSVRMPSHFCGVFGLKPSFGRVPLTPVSTGDYTAHNGPLTRTVGDAALMMSVMAGPHPLDHTSLEAWPADYPGRLQEGVRGRRIAYSPDLGHARVDPEVAALVRRAAERFAELGATVEEVTPAWGKDGPELVRFFWPAHLARLQSKLAEWEDRMDPGLVATMRRGAAVTMEQYMLGRDRKHAYIAAIHSWFEDWDLLLTPAVSVAAFPAEMLSPPDWPQSDWDWMQWAEFSYPFNMSWNPAASVPCGFTDAGLPVGLQIVGRRFDDLGVLQAAAAFEAAAPWADKTPALG